MSDKLEVITPGNLPVEKKPDVVQTGNENVGIVNYGSIQLQVNQRFAAMPQLGGNMYVPSHINRDYYNIFVVGDEAFDKPYFKMLRSRSLCECMSDETKSRFTGMTPENKQEILTMPSLFMAENNRYGNADDDQKVIYGFVSDYKIYENDVKVYWCGYKLDIPQVRLNEMLEDLQLIGNNQFNEMNRTHWAIKRCDLIGELQEAGIAVPIFTYGGAE